ncbi:hypothetical protein GCM10027024_14920 [Microbacterium insulae]
MSESLLLASVPFAWLIVRGITRGIPGGSPLPAPARWNADLCRPPRALIEGRGDRRPTLAMWNVSRS